jgi:hypothetical protein
VSPHPNREPEGVSQGRRPRYRLAARLQVGRLYGTATHGVGFTPLAVPVALTHGVGRRCTSCRGAAP